MGGGVRATCSTQPNIRPIIGQVEATGLSLLCLQLFKVEEHVL
jgi:hypothetical protein